MTNSYNLLFKTGKTTWEALIHNQPETAHFTTVIAEPSNKFVEFYQTLDETGQTIGQGLWDEVVVPYESQDTLCVMGSGTYLMSL